MTKPNTTLIVVLLDRSGSMNSVRADTIGGFNTFLAEQKKAAVDEARLTMVQFDHDYLVTHNNKLLAEVPNLTDETYVPRGNTALLDAMGKAITNTGSTLAALPDDQRPEQVVFVTITDGHENASLTYTKEKISEMVHHQTDVYKWQFVFLGANMDAIAAGQEIGIAVTNAMNFDPKNIKDMYFAVSSNIAHYRTSRSASDLAFTPEQRERNAEDQKN